MEDAAFQSPNVCVETALDRNKEEVLEHIEFQNMVFPFYLVFFGQALLKVEQQNDVTFFHQRIGFSKRQLIGVWLANYIVNSDYFTYRDIEIFFCSVMVCTF